MEEKKNWWTEKDMMLILDLSEMPEQFNSLEEWIDYIKKEEVVVIDSYEAHGNTKLVKMQPSIQGLLDNYNSMINKHLSDVL